MTLTHLDSKHTLFEEVVNRERGPSLDGMFLIYCPPNESSQNHSPRTEDVGESNTTVDMSLPS